VTLPSGQTIRVRGDRPPSAADLAALDDIVAAAQARMAAEPPEQQAEREQRQRDAIARIRKAAGR
jgi:hypothetical protein